MNKKLQVKAVIFDRDGTIINTEGVVINAVAQAFKKLGFEVSPEDMKYILGRSVDNYKEYFLNKWDFDYGEYKRIQKEILLKNLDSAEFIESAVELIKFLYSKNVPLGLATSAGLQTTLSILDRGNLTEMFKVIVTKEDCTNLKPDPEPYIITAEKLGVEPKFCVAIEDTALGIQSAKAAGMFCIAIPNEYSKDNDFSKADAVVQSGSEVESILEFI